MDSSPFGDLKVRRSRSHSSSIDANWQEPPQSHQDTKVSQSLSLCGFVTWCLCGKTSSTTNQHSIAQPLAGSPHVPCVIPSPRFENIKEEAENAELII